MVKRSVTFPCIKKFSTAYAKLKDKQYKQRTSPKRPKTEIEFSLILCQLNAAGFEQPGSGHLAGILNFDHFLVGAKIIEVAPFMNKGALYFYL